VLPAYDARKSHYHFNDFCKDDPRSRFHDREQLPVTERQLAPIGIFDSGAGGLTILTALRQELPSENYVYLGDTAYCPYGVRNEAEIRDLTLRACGLLVEQGVKLIVVACNTASQAALGALRSAYPQVSFVGVVPAVKPAARATRHGRIGIAATNRAVQAAYLQRLIEEFAADIQVHAIGCPELVTLVERGELDGPEVTRTLQVALSPLLEKQVDVIVLGCTHFPALRPAIERIVGDQIQVIDSGAAIARRTHSVLDSEGLLRPLQADGGQLEVWSSGDASAFSRVASKILGYPVTVQQAIE
jgi:glutamate racemase